MTPEKEIVEFQLSKKAFKSGHISDKNQAKILLSNIGATTNLDGLLSGVLHDDFPYGGLAELYSVKFDSGYLAERCEDEKR